MKILYIPLLSLLVTLAHADLLTSKEIRNAEPPEGVGWQIRKDWEIGKDTTFKALFDFTKKGNGALCLGGDLWVAVYDSHQDTRLYAGDHLLSLTFRDLNDDGFSDLVISGTILFFDEKGDDAIDEEPISGTFIYVPEEGVFKPAEIKMLTLFRAAPIRERP